MLFYRFIVSNLRHFLLTCLGCFIFVFLWCARLGFHLLSPLIPFFFSLLLSCFISWFLPFIFLSFYFSQSSSLPCYISWLFYIAISFGVLHYAFIFISVYSLFSTFYVVLYLFLHFFVSFVSLILFSLVFFLFSSFFLFSLHFPSFVLLFYLYISFFPRIPEFFFSFFSIFIFYQFLSSFL